MTDEHDRQAAEVVKAIYDALGWSSNCVPQRSHIAIVAAGMNAAATMERGRCADVAEGYGYPDGYHPERRNAALGIAALIRNGVCAETAHARDAEVERLREERGAAWAEAEAAEKRRQEWAAEVQRLHAEMHAAVAAERARIAARLRERARHLDEQAECYLRAVHSWPEDRPGVATFVFKANEHKFAARVLRHLADDAPVTADDVLRSVEGSHG